jgi:hypothetical protein
LLFRLAGPQVNPFNAAGESRLIVVVRVTPAPVAVMVAVASAVTAAAVAENAALVCPEATVTLEGTVRLGLLLDKLTGKPLDCAATVSVTLQLRVPGARMLPAEQVTALNAGKGASGVTLITPLPPDAGMEFTSEATTPTRLMGKLPAALGAN